MKNNKSTNTWNIVSTVVLVLLVLAEALTFFMIWRLNMVPVKYLLIILAGMAVITGLLSLMMFQHTGKWQKIGHKKQIIAYTLCALIFLVCTIGSIVLVEVGDAVSAITNPNHINVLLEVYVLEDDPAESLNDTRGYIYGYADNTDAGDIQEALNEIQEAVGSEITTRNYTNAFTLIDALMAGEVDAIIMDSSYVTILEDLEAYEDFSSDTKLLHEKVIEKEIPVTTQPTEPTTIPTETTEPEDLSSSSFLLYISGNDARLPLLADGGSDVNILVAVNPETNQILMVNTPRDYYVINHASGNGSRDKLSHCGINGIDNCVAAIESLYGLPIDYYARINFSGFRTLIDAIGGVTVYSDVAFTAHGGYFIYEGENHLNGTYALAFARERKAFRTGDNQRGKNQMKLIEAMIDQLSASTILANYSEILDSLEGMFATSMPSEMIGELVEFQLTEKPEWDINSFAVTGENGEDKCWAVGNGYGYVMYPHEHMVNHATDLITRVLEGEIITEDDLVVEE